MEEALIGARREAHINLVRLIKFYRGCAQLNVTRRSNLELC